MARITGYTDEERQAMRRMRADGMKLAAIAQEFRGSVSQVSVICRDVKRGPWKRSDGTVRHSWPDEARA